MIYLWGAHVRPMPGFNRQVSTAKPSSRGLLFPLTRLPLRCGFPLPMGEGWGEGTPTPSTASHLLRSFPSIPGVVIRSRNSIQSVARTPAWCCTGSGVPAPRRGRLPGSSPCSAGCISRRRCSRRGSSPPAGAAGILERFRNDL